MEEYTPEIISILDEDGNEYDFELLDKIETETGKYAALVPFSDDDEDIEEDSELIILKVIEEDENIFLEPIEDDNEFNEIGELFEERLSDLFLFSEED